MTTLREAAQQALDALEVATTPRSEDRQTVLTAQAALRAALADQSEQTLGMVEPIAYISGYVQGHPVIKTVDETVLLPVGTSFYTAPPQRKPLTDEEVTALVLEWWCPTMVTAKDRKFVRAIERAHGIGEKK